MNTYWDECIREAFDDQKITATEEQLRNIVEWVEGAYENYGLATGLDTINSNHRTSAEIKLESLMADIQKNEDWEARTKVCRNCATTGTTQDSWGRDVTCQDCGGRGRK